MLCEKCKEREAVIHVTQIAGNAMAKHDYCEQCGQKYATSEGMSLADLLADLAIPEKLDDYFRDALPKDTRFPTEAFEFVRDAIERMIRQGGLTHVSAKDLLSELRGLALERFGNSAKSTLAGWGIRRTEDFGEIVFAMINAGLLSKRPEDRQEDFANGYDFDEAFPEN
jgi:uncharacterized repeat protein (TIGR04138 family)